MWIVISKTCQECGGHVAVELFFNQPSSGQIRQIEQELGGMVCIQSLVRNIEPEQTIVINPDEDNAPAPES